MNVRSILDQKGRDVMTVAPDGKLADAIKLLGEKRIGAVVITKPGNRIAGILSERDIVRAIGQNGAAALDLPVSAVMTKNVRTCADSNTINEVMEIMTNGRFRHLPVAVDGVLSGIVSIGDVVKKRIEEVEREAQDIRDYIATA